MVIGMITPNGGEVFFQDEDISQLPMYLRARKGMGYLSQEPSVFQYMSVEDNVVCILEALGVPMHPGAKAYYKSKGLWK